MQAQFAQACLTYLSFHPLSQPCETLQSFAERQNEHAFVAYASQCWGDHVRQVSNPGIDTMALYFLRNPNNVAACAQAAWLTSTPGNIDCSDHRSASALQLPAWFNISSIIPRVYDEILGADTRELIHQKTPLMFACKRGHMDAVRQLLNIGASPNASSSQGTTPMFEAVAGNHVEVVGILLNEAKLQINATNPKKLAAPL